MKNTNAPNVRQWITYCIAFMGLLFVSLTYAQSTQGTPAEVAKAYAPRIFMHPQEEWFPSSVSFFLQHVTKQGNRYVTNDPLESPSSWDWKGAFGQKSNLRSVPVYAFVMDNKREGGQAFTDIAYFTFYPYNRGKEVIKTKWGNHVGDWEHVTIRFRQEGNTYTPIKVSFSLHDTNKVLNWGDGAIQMQGNHLVAYEAHGSHGMYPTAGHHIYKTVNAVIKKIELADDTGAGAAWDTWNNVVTVTQDGSGTFSCVGHNGTPNAENCATWLNYDPQFRWGNAKSGKCGFGECQLNSGPTGPRDKPAVSNPNKFD